MVTEMEYDGLINIVIGYYLSNRWCCIQPDGTILSEWRLVTVHVRSLHYHHRVSIFLVIRNWLVGVSSHEGSSLTCITCNSWFSHIKALVPFIM